MSETEEAYRQTAPSSKVLKTCLKIRMYNSSDLHTNVDIGFSFSTKKKARRWKESGQNVQGIDILSVSNIKSRMNPKRRTARSTEKKPKSSGQSNMFTFSSDFKVDLNNFSKKVIPDSTFELTEICLISLTLTATQDLL